MKSRSIML